MKIHEILAIAAIGASAIRGHGINSAYTEKRDRLKALAKEKKQRVREEIRSRREAVKAGVQ